MRGKRAKELRRLADKTFLRQETQYNVVKHVREHQILDDDGKAHTIKLTKFQLVLADGHRKLYKFFKKEYRRLTAQGKEITVH